MKTNNAYLRVYPCDRAIIQRLLRKILSLKSGEKLFVPICSLGGITLIKIGARIYKGTGGRP